MADPTDLTFGPQAIDTYFDPQPANLIDGNEAFTSDTGQFTTYTEGSAGTFAVSGGRGVITHTGAGSNRSTIVTRTTATLSLPQSFVSVQIPSIPTTSAGYDNTFVGLFKDGSNFVAAGINRVNGAGFIIVTVAGVQTIKGTVTGYTWTAPLTLGFSLVGTQAVLWADVGGGWTSITGAFITEFDPQTTTALSGYKAGLEHTSQDASEWQFDNLTWGRFGGVGMRDIQIVTNEDGSVYEVGNDIYFTATLPDALGGGYSGVFQMDMTTFDYEQVAVVMFEISSSIYPDGGSLGLVRDSSGDFHVTASTWGSGGGFGGTIRVRYKHETTLDLLSGTRVVQSTAELNLPGLLTASYGAYDAMLVKDGATWLLAYTITTNTTFAGNPFYAALASSSDLSTWTLVGADTGNQGWEGTVLIPYLGNYYVITGGPAGSGNSSRVYDDSLTFLGALNATFSGGADTIPHPMVFEHGTNIYLISHNNTRHGGVSFTWGKPTLQIATGTASGISGVALSTTSIRLTITPSAGATDHSIYASTTYPIVIGAPTLVVSGLGAAPAPYDHTGLVAGTEYFYLVRNNFADSSTIKVATTGATIAPNLRLDALAATSATFSVNNDPLYIETRFQRTLLTDSLFFTPQSNVQSTTTDRYVRIETGLTTGVNYLERAQVRVAAGWSDWTSAISYIPAATSIVGAGLPGGNIFIAPKHGQPVPGSGNTVTLTWFTGFGTPTLLEWSPLFTDVWATITSSGLSGGTYAWDVTAIATGTRVRVRLTIGSALYEHPGFIIDKTGTALTMYLSHMEGSFAGWSAFGATTNNTWALGVFAQLVCSSFTGLQRASQWVWGQLHSPSPGAARLAVTGFSGAGYGDAHFVTITGAIFTGGGGFRWEYWYGAEHASIGACIQFDDGSYIAAYFQTQQLPHPIGQCPGGDNFQGQFIITSSDATTSEAFNESQTSLYAAGSTYPFTCSSTCYEREWDYHVSLDWDRPSANSIRVRGRLGAPYNIVLEETWNFSGQFAGGACGYPGIWSAHQDFSLSGVGNKWREIYNFGFVNTDAVCGVQPPPAEPPEAEPFPGEPCSVHLFTFEPDRTTVEWQVANVSPNVPTYLVDPSDSGSGYGEQEVDFIQGSASLGQVGVAVIDPKQIANDQDSGWMTERLSDAFDRTAIKGRRHRLLRYISVAEGWIVLADGDAGPPRLGDSFSHYEWEIRDTRERERKTKAFYRSSTTIMPRGGTDPWGTFNTQSDLGQQIGFAVDWPIYLTGRVVAGLVNIIGVDLRESHWTGNSCGIVCAVNPNTRAVMKGDATISQGSVYPFPTRVVVQWLNLEIWWRLAGTLDDWTIVQPIIDVTGVDEVQTYLSLGAFPSVAVTLPTYTVAYGVYNEICQINEDASVAGDDHLWGATHIIMGTGPRTSQFLRYAKPRGTPTPALPTPTPNNLPTVGQQVEILVWYKGEPTEHLPYHYEGTVGDFLQRAYDGEFSEPDPITGATVPSGVRYDPAALALMTEPVLIRIGEKTDDLREFLEKRIYQPYGYAPALDNDGRVSPKHEALPTAGLSSLTLIDNDNTEAVPGWEHGDRIINRINYTYHRYFNHPGKVREEGNVIKLEPSGDSIGMREVKFEYWDPESIDQFDEQKIEIDATAASTTGQFTGEPWFEIALEPGAIYADRRYQNISRRYSYGSPVVTVKCFRTGPRGTSHLRAGDWCRIDLSWMPDYLTRRRGTQRYGQIVAIRDLDCAWREITFELVQYLGATGGAVLGAVATGGTAVATATTSAVLGAVASTMTVTAAHSYSGMVAVAGAVAEGSAHIYTSSAVAGAAATGGDETVGAGPLDGGWGFEPFGDVFGEGS